MDKDKSFVPTVEWMAKKKGSIEINPNMNLGVYSPLELNN